MKASEARLKADRNNNVEKLVAELLFEIGYTSEHGGYFIAIPKDEIGFTKYDCCIPKLLELGYTITGFRKCLLIKW